ncbi:MAG: small multi-drug export protein [Anaerolineae bacterium]|nr:small multi-drug export protein [Anaerolineae bacterium]
MDVLAELGKIASVFGVAFFSLWGAVPVGLALGLSPVIITITCAISYGVGAWLVLFLGEPFRRWLYQRIGHKLPADPNSRTRRLLDKYGAVGLGGIAPVTLGSQLGALLGLMINMPRGRLFVALVIGGLVWSIVFTLAFILGVAGVQAVIG